MTFAIVCVVGLVATSAFATWRLTLTERAFDAGYESGYESGYEAGRRDHR
jgi:hypothetical protein